MPTIPIRHIAFYSLSGLALAAAIGQAPAAEPPGRRISLAKYHPGEARIAASILKSKRTGSGVQAEPGPGVMIDSDGLTPGGSGGLASPLPAPLPGAGAAPVIDPRYAGQPSIVGEETFAVSAGPEYATCGVVGGDCPGAESYCWIDALSIFAGRQAFKNPTNRGQDGSFGFHEGVNWGLPTVLSHLGVGTQIGFHGVHSNLSGASYSNRNRNQYFVTGGFFRRAAYGWQGGIVLDYLNDNWYYDLDVTQLRAELSLAWAGQNSLGFWWAQPTSSGSSLSRLTGEAPTEEEWEPHRLYAFFYRLNPRQAGWAQFHLFAGFTGDSDGLIGTDAKLPIFGAWSMETNFTYLAPDEDRRRGGTLEESWNLAVNLAWYPGRAHRGESWSFSPLFDVAGNGSLIVRRK
jgi:hypothetical protein